MPALVGLFSISMYILMEQKLATSALILCCIDPLSFVPCSLLIDPLRVASTVVLHVATTVVSSSSSEAEFVGFGDTIRVSTKLLQVSQSGRSGNGHNATKDARSAHANGNSPSSNANRGQRGGRVQMHVNRSGEL